MTVVIWCSGSCIRSKLVFAKKTGELPAAVGVSLFLEKFVGCVEDVKDLVAAGRVEVSQIVAGLGCGSSVLAVLVCAIGQKQLKDRINLFNKFRAAKINVDHCHCLTQKEAESVMEDLCVPNIVMLTNSDKADVRICNDPTSRTLERKIPLEKNHAKSVLQLAEHSFINRKCQNLSNSNSPHDFWHLAKNNSNNFTSSSFHPLFHPDGTTAISSVSKAELFSQTFTNNSPLDLSLPLLLPLTISCLQVNIATPCLLLYFHLPMT
ncbi:hypothetical protein E2C01_036284 [Portunus trituberculatus]|uniref:Uncharacterized protein n=1 Tax=Portunus trituberculatus TaxID=210409 RepID=A0A5B7FAT0_PORTR|nr:hypothetical protein [Portunus trituberculatus]